MAVILPNRYPGHFDPASASYPQGKFKNRSSPDAEDGSYMERDWINDFYGFFGALLNGAGVTPDGTVDTAISSQLYDALRVVSGAKYGSALIGELVYWPLQQMPQEIFTDMGQVYIPYIGQAFSKTTYPLLGLVHPSGVLPADMRGEFARGWDNGRGVDAGRGLVSSQGDQAKAVPMAEGQVSSNISFMAATQGPFGSRIYPIGRDVRGSETSNMTGTTGTETRPRNIAWNIIVRAA